MFRVLLHVVSYLKIQSPHPQHEFKCSKAGDHQVAVMARTGAGQRSGGGIVKPVPPRVVCTLSSPRRDDTVDAVDVDNAKKLYKGSG